MGQGTKVPGSELARVLLADSLPGANWPGSEKAVNHHLSPINSKQTHSSNNRFFLYYRILVAVVLVLSSCHK